MCPEQTVTHVSGTLTKNIAYGVPVAVGAPSWDAAHRPGRLGEAGITTPSIVAFRARLRPAPQPISMGVALQSHGQSSQAARPWADSPGCRCGPSRMALAPEGSPVVKNAVSLALNGAPSAIASQGGRALAARRIFELCSEIKRFR